MEWMRVVNLATILGFKLTSVAREGGANQADVENRGMAAGWVRQGL